MVTLQDRIKVVVDYLRPNTFTGTGQEVRRRLPVELWKMEPFVEDQDRRRFWDILSALRGPDYPDGIGFPVDAIKQATTAIIRWHFFLEGGFTVQELMESSNDGVKLPMDRHPDSEKYRDLRLSLVDGHFIWHARAAFKALGLHWGQVNP